MVEVDIRPMAVSYSFPTVKFKVIRVGENANFAPHILTLSVNRATHDATIMLSGGRGDQAIARISTEVSQDVTHLIIAAMGGKIELENRLTRTVPLLAFGPPNPTAIMPLVDALRSVDHWIAPLLARWWDAASKAPEVTELTPLKKTKRRNLFGF